MQAAGIEVLEVTTPDKNAGRRRGKNDHFDAESAAHAAFAEQYTVTPRSRDGMGESLRSLRVRRKTAVQVQPRKLMRAEGQRKAKFPERSYAASSDTSSAKSTAISAYQPPRMMQLDRCRSFNAVADKFVNLFKYERIRRRIYRTREEAKKDVFDNIKMF